jgi:hypothetical protein
VQALSKKGRWAFKKSGEDEDLDLDGLDGVPAGFDKNPDGDG